MIQSALMLMGDTSQHQSSLRRKTLLQHLNPLLKDLMKNSDFSKGHPFLSGKNFGEMAKAKLEAAAALKKVAYPTSKGSKQGFWEGYPRRNNWATGVADTAATALGDQRKTNHQLSQEGNHRWTSQQDDW